MPRVFRFKCTFRCKRCGKKTMKMGSCQPKACGCGNRKGSFDLVRKIDLKSKG